MNIEFIRGLMRPFVTVSFVLATFYLVITGKISPDNFLPMVGMIVAFHFGERSALKNGKETLNNNK